MNECDLCGGYFDPDDMRECEDCGLDLCEACYLAHMLIEHSNNGMTVEETE